MWLSALEIGAAQLRFVAEIAPPQPFLCANRSPSRHDFRGDAKAILYDVSKVLGYVHSLPDSFLCRHKLNRYSIRGGQREYSSKPLKYSIVKRILVFKR